MNKKIIFIVIGILIGLVISVGGAYAATTIIGSSVTYSNSSSGLSSTTVQAAIDELNTKTDIRKMGNFIGVYKYSTATSTKCITGEESTCVKSTCYKTKRSGSCPAGTIVKYKVNDATVVNFHVMYDNGSTMTMQSQKNTVYNIPWISKEDYTTANTNGTSCSYDSCSDEGPLTILKALESVTAGWSNVNNQTYTIGTTVFKTNAYTSCNSYNSCSGNAYTLASRTAKARIITLQEVANLGCSSISACPIWMYNYLFNSVESGGTINDTAYGPNWSNNAGYWTITGTSNTPHGAWRVSVGDEPVTIRATAAPYYGARAVVVVSK